MRTSSKRDQLYVIRHLLWPVLRLMNLEIGVGLEVDVGMIVDVKVEAEACSTSKEQASLRLP